MLKGDGVDGISYDDSSSYDSSDSDEVASSSNDKPASPKINNGTASERVTVLESKQDTKVSGFSKIMATSSRQESSFGQPSMAANLNNKKDETTLANVKTAAKTGTFSIKLGAQKPKEAPVTGMKRASELVAKVFNPDEESEEEEMPPEAKMRMRNIGKDTPTAEGPNSFSKGKLGFCNRQKLIQRELDQVAGDPPKKKNFNL